MATKAKASKKVAVKKVATVKKATTKKVVEPKEGEKGPGKIAQIIDFHKKGYTNAEIVAEGFNKTTVSIQVSKYKKGL